MRKAGGDTPRVGGATGDVGAGRAVASLKLRLGVLLALLLVFLIVVAAATTKAVQDRDEAVTRVEAVLNPTRDELRELFQAMVDQETGQRGFLLTRGDQFLEPWDRGRSDEQRLLADLRRRLQDEPELMQAIDRVALAAEAWRTNFAEPELETARRSRIEAADMVATGIGKAAFDHVRKVLDEITALVDARVASAREDLAAARTRQARTLVAGLLMTVAMIVFVSVMVVHWVLGPVTRLRGNVRRVAAGELDHVVPSDGPRELAELGDDIEAMRMRIIEEVDATAASSRNLEVVNAELKRSNADLAQFAYVASHDLSEPLRAIASFSQLLADDHRGRLGPEADEYLAYIESGVSRMRALLDGLLRYARVGRNGIVPEPIDLNQVLVEIRQDLGALIEDEHADVSVHELPTVLGDRTQLHQLFQNLVANALKFHRPDVPPTIDIAAVTEGEQWCVSVSDNGIGIEPQYRDRVFGMFKRLHARDAYDGSGIGLAVCRRIVEGHGGEIRIETNEPGGTRVTVRLPAES